MTTKGLLGLPSDVLLYLLNSICKGPYCVHHQCHNLDLAAALKLCITSKKLLQFYEPKLRSELQRKGDVQKDYKGQQDPRVLGCVCLSFATAYPQDIAKALELLVYCQELRNEGVGNRAALPIKDAIASLQRSESISKIKLDDLRVTERKVRAYKVSLAKHREEKMIQQCVNTKARILIVFLALTKELMRGWGICWAVQTGVGWFCWARRLRQWLAGAV